MKASSHRRARHADSIWRAKPNRARQCSSEQPANIAVINLFIEQLLASSAAAFQNGYVSSLDVVTKNIYSPGVLAAASGPAPFHSRASTAYLGHANAGRSSARYFVCAGTLLHCEWCSLLYRSPWPPLRFMAPAVAVGIPAIPPGPDYNCRCQNAISRLRGF
jgi:hypothetical protein